MQTEIKKNLAIVFRICIFAAFFSSLMYTIKFFGILNSRNIEKNIRLFSMSYYGYIVFILVGLVLSIVCFKSTSIVSSIFRTISLAGVALILFNNLSVVRFFNDLLKIADSDNYEQMRVMAERADRIANDYQAAEAAMLSIGTVPVMFILSITSVVALVKVLKCKSKSE